MRACQKGDDLEVENRWARFTQTERRKAFKIVGHCAHRGRRRRACARACRGIHAVRKIARACPCAGSAALGKKSMSRAKSMRAGESPRARTLNAGGSRTCAGVASDKVSRWSGNPGQVRRERRWLYVVDRIGRQSRGHKMRRARGSIPATRERENVGHRRSGATRSPMQVRDRCASVLSCGARRRRSRAAAQRHAARVAAAVVAAARGRRSARRASGCRAAELP